VDEPQILCVALELEEGSDPPRGRVLVDDAIHPFAGWLGLAVALEQAIAGEHDAHRAAVPATAAAKDHGASVVRAARRQREQ
jgi:hypothetical protein